MAQNKKKKKGRTLLILCLILVVLSAGYAGLRWHNSKADEETDSDDSEEIVSLVSLSGDPASLSYTVGDITMEIEKKDDVWVRSDETDFPLNDDTVSTLVNALAGAEVQQTIDPLNDDLAQYGLEDPAATFTMTDTNGDSVTILLGNDNSQAGGSYAMVEGADQVLLTDSGLSGDLYTNWYDMAEVESAPSIDQDDVDTITVTEGDTTTSLVQIPYGDDTYDPTGTCTLFFDNGDGTYQSMDSSYETAIYSAVTGFGYSSLACFDPTDDQLEVYGLKDPTAEVRVDYTTTVEQTVEDYGETGEDDSETTADDETAAVDDAAEDTDETETSEEVQTVTVEEAHTYTLSVGSYNETEDAYYVAADGSTSCIYLMSADTISALLGMDPAEMVNLSPADVVQDTVDSMDIATGGSTVTYAIDRSAAAEEDTSDSTAAEDDADTADSSDGDESTDTAVSDDTSDSGTTDDGTDTADSTSEDEADSTNASGNVYLKNGEAIEASEFSDVYEAVAGLTGTRVLAEGEAVSGEPAVTITFHRNTSDQDYTITLYQWNDNYYQMAVDGGAPTIAVDIGKVKTLLSLIS